MDTENRESASPCGAFPAPDWHLFCPPSPGVGVFRWLWDLTPPGASALPISPEARADPAQYRPGPGFVPHLGGPAAPRADLSLFPAVRQHELAWLVEQYAPGLHRISGSRKPRAGTPAWRVEAAYRYDVLGASNAEIADGSEYVDAEQDYRGRSRSADRLVREGRQLLAALGAWPWVVAARGVLPARWFELEPYARALADWHRESVLMAANDALVAVDSITERQEMRLTPDRIDTAERVYFERLKRAS